MTDRFYAPLVPTEEDDSSITSINSPCEGGIGCGTASSESEDENSEQSKDEGTPVKQRKFSSENNDDDNTSGHRRKRYSRKGYSRTNRFKRFPRRNKFYSSRKRWRKQVDIF